MPRKKTKTDAERRKYYRDWHAANKERQRKLQRQRYRAPEGRAAYIWRAARTRAKEKGIAFSITSDDVLSLIETGKCALSGIPFVFTKAKTLRNPFAPSLDRINPKNGYTKGNVRAVCVLGNYARSNWTDKELIAFCKGVSGRAK